MLKGSFSEADDARRAVGFYEDPLMNLRLRESVKPHLIFVRRLLYFDPMPLLSA